MFLHKYKEDKVSPNYWVIETCYDIVAQLVVDDLENKVLNSGNVPT